MAENKKTEEVKKADVKLIVVDSLPTQSINQYVDEEGNVIANIITRDDAIAQILARVINIEKVLGGK